jgi:hypothetical protein
MVPASFAAMDLISAIDGKGPLGPRATDALRRDHEKVRELFDEYRRRMDDAPEACRALAGAACMRWELHARLEEEFLYPALGRGSPETAEARRAHEDIDECIATIRRWPADSERDSTMLRMMQLAGHHMDREEETLFPLAERVLADRLEAIGRAMRRRREELAGSTAEMEGRS